MRHPARNRAEMRRCAHPMLGGRDTGHSGDAVRGVSYWSAHGASEDPEHHTMSEDAKLGLLLLFMVFAVMVIGPVLAR